MKLRLSRYVTTIRYLAVIPLIVFGLLSILATGSHGGGGAVGGTTTTAPSLLFNADDGVNGRELWKSDGTDAGTVLVKDINAMGPSISNFSQPAFTVFNGALYFRADDGVNGVELWKSDGTAAGTVLVKDINSGVPGDSSNPGFQDRPAVFNGALYFAAFDGADVELWKTDGTAAGTVLAKDINGTGWSSPAEFIVFNGVLYFSADDGMNGVELWKSDGTDVGTVLVKDINGTGDSNPTGFTVFNGALYFSADNGVDGVELWKSDGTDAGTVLVKNIRGGGAGSGSFPQEFAVLNDALYFSASDGNGMNGRELWKTDGTDAGTVLVKNIRGGGAGSFPQGFTVFNGDLYFSANDGMQGRELWKTDGTDPGTVQVKDINTVTVDSNPGWFTVFNGELYFSADDGMSGVELWKTDGTDPGTVQVKDISPAGESLPEELTPL